MKTKYLFRIALLLVITAAAGLASCKKDKKDAPADTCGIPELKMVSAADVANPCGIAVSAGGKVAVTEYKRPYGSSGLTKIWNSYSDLLANKPPIQMLQNIGAEAVAFDNNENLYVTETEQTARIVVYVKARANGADTYRYQRQIQEGFENPRGIAFDSKNRLYLVDDGKDRLLRFNDPMNSSAFAVVASVFGNPKGLAIANDTLYLTGYKHNRLYKSELTSAGSMGQTIIISLPTPVDVATYGKIVAIASPAASTITLLNAGQIKTSDAVYGGCTKEIKSTGELFGLAFVKTDKGYGLLSAQHTRNKIVLYQ